MKASSIGQKSEAAVARLLENRGYEILARNWRTRKCEIDIVAKKLGAIYFVEVKYRSQTAQGDGFEYITAAKLKQMNFAARVWIAEYNWEGDYRLAAASVSGLLYENIEIIEI